MAYSPETKVGNYEIISVLGKGGMGEIYLAYDKELDRKIAIKFLNDEFSEDDDKLSRFIQEAKAASALNHPHILTVYEFGKYENSRFIVTEHIDGETLTEVLRKKLLETGKAIEYAIQITSALATAHEAGIIHRDIKASNVMIRKDGIVKLLDFGLAKLLEKRERESERGSEDETLLSPSLSSASVSPFPKTEPGMLIGTPTYMSPEQVRGKELDVRTDIFSFGILFFEMLTGVRPFTGESYADIMGAILKDEHPPLSRYIENVSPELENILNKTLRKDREQRYQSIKDLMIDLKDLEDNIKFEAKLIHTTQNTKNNLIHSTDSIAHHPTVIIKAEKNYVWQKLVITGLVFVFLATGSWWLINTFTKQTLPFEKVSNLNKTEIVSWNSAPGELFSSGEFSPDGKFIVYSSAKSGSRDIWIKQTVSGESVRITRDDFNNQDPIWSPTGNEIAFFSDRGGQTDGKENATGIWKMPTLGGTPTLITSVTDGSTQLKYWSKSGKIYYQSNNNLSAVDIKSGKTEPVTDFSPKKFRVKAISISPDEKQIAYVRNADNKWWVLVTNVGQNDPQPIAESESEIESLIWHPDSKRILYSAASDQTFQIYGAFAEKESKSQQITFSEMHNIVVDISDDGQNILIGSSKEESNLWEVNIKTGEERTIISGIESELWASVTGQKIAYQSVKSLSQGNNLRRGTILVKDLTKESQPGRIAENGFLPNWSPDGNRLAFLREAGKNLELWTVEQNGSREKRISENPVQSVGYSVSPYNRIQTNDFSWSPDSKEIAYSSAQDGLSNIRLATADGSGERVFTDNRDKFLTLYCPVWSADGKALAYYTKSQKPDAGGRLPNGFWIKEKGSEKARKIAELDYDARLIGWSPDEKKLIFASPSKKFSSLPPEVLLREIVIETGEIKPLKTLKNVYYLNIYLSADRKKIAYVSRLNTKDDIWILYPESQKEEKLTNNNDSNLYFSSLAWSPDGGAIYFGKQTRYSLLSMITNFDKRRSENDK